MTPLIRIHCLAALAVALAMVAVPTSRQWLERQVQRAGDAPPVKTPERPAAASSAPATAERAQPAARPPPGDAILANYASKASTARQDLDRLAHLLVNFQLLVKARDALPLGGNEDIVDALTGNNPNRLEFVSREHPAIDGQGRIVDRWGTPVFFHAMARDRIDIRSAGPDAAMWTADDVHRDPNGVFRTDDRLLAASLF